jgi:ribosomal protein L3
VIITRLFHLRPVERHVTNVDAEAGSSGRVTVDSDAEVKGEGAGKMVDDATTSKGKGFTVPCSRMDTSPSRAQPQT